MSAAGKSAHDPQGSDGDEDEEKKNDLAKLSRQDLFHEITKIWINKKRQNTTLVELSKEIRNKKDEIKEIKTKMAIESNELNIMGNEILKIENKIKELTQSGQAQANDKDKKDKNGKDKPNSGAKNDDEGGDPFQKIENQ